MTQLVLVPAINGLGKTKSAEKTPKELAKALVQKPLNLKINNDNIKEQQSFIFEQAKFILQKKEKTIFLGGDHSISYPLVKAFYQTQEKPFLIILDAHPDLMPPMKEPTHEEWLRALIEKENFPPQNIILIGARKIDQQEQDFMNGNKIKNIPIKKIQDHPNKIIKEIKSLTKNKDIYLSFDIDVFDKSIAKATGYPESQGLTKKQGLKFLSSLVSKINLKAADLVEIHKDKSGFKDTLSLGLEILEILKQPPSQS